MTFLRNYPHGVSRSLAAIRHTVVRIIVRIVKRTLGWTMDGQEAHYSNRVFVVLSG